MSARLLLWLMTVVMGCGIGVTPILGQTKPLTEDELAAFGLQKFTSKHLTLITDVREREDVKELNDVFEKAIGQWCQYFAIPESTVGDWHITGYVMMDDARFKRAGLMSEDLPPFPAGFQMEEEMWIYVQEGDYYTRHLLLHEGTHAFMLHFLKGYGPAWYAEGMAEMLALHQWKDKQLKLRHDVKDREEVPFWGRVKIIRDDYQAGLGRTMLEVMKIEPEAFTKVQSYGWAWAACQFFDTHPDFQATFRKLPSLVDQSPLDFNTQFLIELESQWPQVEQEWLSMIDEIEFGYDVASAAPVAALESRIEGGETIVRLATDRGWQATGITIDSSMQYSFWATGQFQVKHDGQPWPCEANGVTLEYYNGRPLGRLIAKIVDDSKAMSDVFEIGEKASLTFPESGELYLRINESPAAWHDNRGELQVRVRPVTE